MFRLLKLCVLVISIGLFIGCLPVRWEEASTYVVDKEELLTLPVGINSEPSGAKVYVDDKYIGDTPITVNFNYYKIRKWMAYYERQVKGYGEKTEVVPGGTERNKYYRGVDFDDWIVRGSYKIVIYLDGYEKVEQELEIPETGADTFWGKSGLLPREEWKYPDRHDYGFGFKNKYIFFLKATAPKVAVSQQQQQQQTIVIPGAGGQIEKTGSINLVSVPENCEIIVDGAYVGNTPATLKLPEGMHKLEVKTKGFKTWERTIRVLAESTAQLKAELEKEE